MNMKSEPQVGEREMSKAPAHDHTNSEPWKVLESEYLIRRPWLTVRRECLELPDGRIVPEYYVLEYPDWVNVIAITEDGNVILERQYRHGFGQAAWEIPCGVLEQSDASPLAGAQRELLEETGYSEGEWTLLDTLSGNPASTNNRTYCFLARGVKKVGEPRLDAGESFDVKLFPLEVIPKMLLRGEFVQALHVAPLWKYFYLTGGGLNDRPADCGNGEPIKQ